MYLYVELQVCIGRISSLLMKYVLRHVHEKKYGHMEQLPLLMSDSFV